MDRNHHGALVDLHRAEALVLDPDLPRAEQRAMVDQAIQSFARQRWQARLSIVANRRNKDADTKPFEEQIVSLTNAIEDLRTSYGTLLTEVPDSANM